MFRTAVTLSISLCLLVGHLASQPARPAVRATHVIVIGFDGLSPRGIKDSKTPSFDHLIKNGASTMSARAVFPTSSSSNWASMIMGVGPEQHGITSNDWQPDKYAIAPVVPGPAGFSETLFSVYRRLRPEANIAIFHDWKDFGRLVEPGVPTVISNEKGPRATMKRAIEYFQKQKPALMFVHLDHIDHAGHKSGWNSPAYKQAVELGDTLTGELVKAVEDAGVFDRTVFLLTADHGGVGTRHGGETMEELLIPWIISGPGIRKGFHILRPVNTYDTACTVLSLLGAGRPEYWICRPVREVFAD